MKKVQCLIGMLAVCGATVAMETPADALTLLTWSQITSSTTTGWPTGGVGSISLSHGSNYIPATVGTDSGGTTTWWVMDPTGYLYYSQNALDASPFVDKNSHSRASVVYRLNRSCSA